MPLVPFLCLIDTGPCADSNFNFCFSEKHVPSKKKWVKDEREVLKKKSPFGGNPEFYRAFPIRVEMQRSLSKNTLADQELGEGTRSDGSGQGKDGRTGTAGAVAEHGWASVALLLAIVPVCAAASHILTPPEPDGRELSEAAWYSVDIVKASQRNLAGLDGFLSAVSSASNPSQILHRVVPVLSCTAGPQAALKVLVAYVAADVSNLALKWPLQGDRPFWMDAAVRQFGSNTCEVGFGMPSGHVQVTVAGYATVATLFRNRIFDSVVIATVGLYSPCSCCASSCADFSAPQVLLTALSRVHMGAHTPLQVACGGIAGLATARGVHLSERVLLRWGSPTLPNATRLCFSAAAAVGIIIFIAAENAALLSQGLAIYASVSHAISACRGGLHAVVSSARGIARDVGALLGGVVGVSVLHLGGAGSASPHLPAGRRFAVRSRHPLYTHPNYACLFEVFVFCLSADLILFSTPCPRSMFVQVWHSAAALAATELVLRLSDGAHDVCFLMLHARPSSDLPGEGTQRAGVTAGVMHGLGQEEASTVAVFAKYFLLLAFGVGISPRAIKWLLGR